MYVHGIRRACCNCLKTRPVRLSYACSSVQVILIIYELISTPLVRATAIRLWIAGTNWAARDMIPFQLKISTKNGRFLPRITAMQIDWHVYHEVFVRSCCGAPHRCVYNVTINSFRYSQFTENQWSVQVRVHDSGYSQALGFHHWVESAEWHRRLH